MILSFFTQKSTRSAKFSSVFAERFSGEGQADFVINKAHKVSLKGRNNLYISCVFNGFKYITPDSLSVLQALNHTMSKNQQIQNILLKHHSISEFKTIVYCWVPSHVGIYGNEQVDKITEHRTNRF